MRRTSWQWFVVATASALGGCGGGDAAEPVTVTLFSVAAEDGSVNSDGGFNDTAGPLFVGDQFNVGTASQQGVRGFLSFDISSIPKGATVLEATLTAFQFEVAGTPYSTLGSLLVDHVVYGSQLDPGAYSRSALEDAIGTFSTDPSVGTRSLVVTAAVQEDVGGPRTRTQYRLRFATENDGDATADQSHVHSAETATTIGERPTLVVTYQP